MKPKDSSVLRSNSLRASSSSLNGNLDKSTGEVGTQQSASARGRLYTIEEAAGMLHLKPTWLYERTRKNAIPHHRFGKYIRFTEADLDGIIAMASQPESHTVGRESA
jgi:excisionase family DNA binding protein